MDIEGHYLTKCHSQSLSDTASVVEGISREIPLVYATKSGKGVVHLGSCNVNNGLQALLKQARFGISNIL